MKYRYLGLIAVAASLVAARSFVGCGGTEPAGPRSKVSPTSDTPPSTVPSSADASVEAGTNDGPPVSDGCAYDKSKSAYSSESLGFGDGTRTYGLFVPAPCDPSKPLPVVFLFHGDGGNGASMRGFGLEDQVAGRAVLVYPDGPNKTWDLESRPENNQDYKFFDALLEDVGKKASIDKSRVFAFGFSRGGFFVNQLGCFRGDKVRAVAAHSGGGPYSEEDGVWDDDGLFTGCNTPPTAAMVIHGESDGVVPYDKGGKYSARYWQTKNQCQTSTTDFAPSPCVGYQGCQQGHPVVWCSIPSLGHQPWSNATQAAWNFFKQF